MLLSGTEPARAGSVEDAARARLLGEGLPKLVAEAAAGWDLVVVLGGVTEPDGDAAVAAAATDLALLVVPAGSHVQTVARAEERLHRTTAGLLGATVVGGSGRP